MLHVSAMSVFYPVDQELSEQELLVSNGDEMASVLSFGGDRYDEAYVGPVGHGNFGVVEIHDGTPWKVDFRSVSLAITGNIYRWQAFADPDDHAAPPGHGFIGPERLDAKGLAAIKLPKVMPDPPFPLASFVFVGLEPG